MKCNKCENIAELRHSRDQETGMYSNRWVCEDHGTIDPTDITSMDAEQFNAEMMKRLERLIDSYEYVISTDGENCILDQSKTTPASSKE